MKTLICTLILATCSAAFSQQAPSTRDLILEKGLAGYINSTLELNNILKAAMSPLDRNQIQQTLIYVEGQKVRNVVAVQYEPYHGYFLELNVIELESTVIFLELHSMKPNSQADVFSIRTFDIVDHWASIIERYHSLLPNVQIDPIFRDAMKEALTDTLKERKSQNLNKLARELASAGTVVPLVVKMGIAGRDEAQAATANEQLNILLELFDSNGNVRYVCSKVIASGYYYSLYSFDTTFAPGVFYVFHTDLANRDMIIHAKANVGFPVLKYAADIAQSQSANEPGEVPDDAAPPL